MLRRDATAPGAARGSVRFQKSVWRVHFPRPVCGSRATRPASAPSQVTPMQHAIAEHSHWRGVLHAGKELTERWTTALATAAARRCAISAAVAASTSPLVAIDSSSMAIRKVTTGYCRGKPGWCRMGYGRINHVSEYEWATARLGLLLRGGPHSSPGALRRRWRRAVVSWPPSAARKRCRRERQSHRCHPELSPVEQSE
eukprot:scaffold251398_cov31-Tisochrysis_lutea.AAC.5